MNTDTEIIKCKYCQSANTIKFGAHKDIQRYYCKDCQRKFTLLDTLPKMQTSVDQISSAVAMYYEGLSLNEIRRMLKQIYSIDISDQGIYNWVERFTNDARKIIKGYHPDVGYVWLADETVIDIAGKPLPKKPIGRPRKADTQAIQLSKQNPL